MLLLTFSQLTTMQITKKYFEYIMLKHLLMLYQIVPNLLLAEFQTARIDIVIVQHKSWQTLLNLNQKKKQFLMFRQIT